MAATLDWVEGEARVAWILAGCEVQAIAAAFGTGVHAVQMQKRRVLEALREGRPSKHMERFAELGLLPPPLVQTRSGGLYGAPKG
jgi:hypothetical protein